VNKIRAAHPLSAAIVVVTLLLLSSCGDSTDATSSTAAPASAPATTGATPVTEGATSSGDAPGTTTGRPEESLPAPVTSAETDTTAAPDTTTVTTDTTASPDTISTTAEAEPTNGADTPAMRMNRRLARTANIGATLELAADEYPWGPDLDPGDFADIAEVGFTAVRLPVKWSDRADEEAPYALDADFVARVNEALDAAEANGLAVVLNVHHYDEIHVDPAGHRDRLVGIWRQLTATFGDRPNDSVVFETMNEPNSELTTELWSDISTEIAEAIWETNPERVVMIGGVGWNGHEELTQMTLPDHNGRLIATFHYYSPFEFTHQGAVWVEGADQWLGTRWDPNEGVADIDTDFFMVSDWSQEVGVPVFVGEFGVLDLADPDDALEWLREVRITAEIAEFSWAVWDWASPNFGIHDDETEEWNDDQLDALIPGASGQVIG
jgi:endoglucanase